AVTIEGISRTFNEEYWNYAKLISGVLRHEMPMQYVVELVSSLNLNDEHINTWKNGIARALKKYIGDGKAEGIKCTECGGSNVVFEESCYKCRDCGFSKCS